jgi:hypothetical protein
MKTLSAIVGLFLTANASQLLEITDEVPKVELFKQTKNRFGNMIQYTKHDTSNNMFE